MVGILNDPLSLIFAASGINVSVKHNLLYVQLSEPLFAELCGLVSVLLLYQTVMFAVRMLLMV